MKTIVRQDDVRRQNQSVVLVALRREGPLSRTELCSRTGLSPSTVTVITNSLLERGVLAEEPGVEGAAARRGRPQVRLFPNPDYASVVTVMLSVNRFEIDISDYAGRSVISETVRMPTRAMSARKFTESLVDAVGRAASEVADVIAPIARIALGVEGIVDGAGRTLVSSPVIDCGNVPVAQALSDAFGVPVVAANECNMMAEAMSWRAPERFDENFATVLLSVGVGMGLFLNGRVFSGINSSAVEFGHICYEPDGALCRCGRHGCIEAYAGAHSIFRAANGFDTGRMLAEEPAREALTAMALRARAGDGLERQAFVAAGKAVGTGLSNLFTMFDPIPVMFAGPGVAFMDLMRPSIEAALARPCFGQPVQISIFDEEIDYRALVKEGSLMSALSVIDATLPGPGENGARLAERGSVETSA